MAYIPLTLNPEPGHRVGSLIRRLEDHYFRDVHAMLRLPLPDVGITPRCNFAIAQILACVVSGVSVTLYQHHGSKGNRFKGVLVDYYPWADEPQPPADNSEVARLIYSLVRNPLTHDLGLDLETKAPTEKVVVKRLLTNHKTCGRTEPGIEALEAKDRPRRLSPTIKRETGRVVLLLDAFYWGIRRMLLNLNADTNKMRAAEAFLESLGKP